jgi:hypothetical protein
MKHVASGSLGAPTTLHPQDPLTVLALNDVTISSATLVRSPLCDLSVFHNPLNSLYDRENSGPLHEECFLDEHYRLILERRRSNDVRVPERVYMGVRPY